MQDSMRRAFLDDGAVLIKGVLTKEQLAQCRAAFDWAVENPGPNAFRIFDGTEQQSHNDNANPLAKARLDELVPSLPFGRLFADLWGSEHVWYFAEEVFLKAGGRGIAHALASGHLLFALGRHALGQRVDQLRIRPQAECLGDRSRLAPRNSLRRDHLPRSGRSDPAPAWRQRLAPPSRYRGAAKARPTRLRCSLLGDGARRRGRGPSRRAPRRRAGRRRLPGAPHLGLPFLRRRLDLPPAAGPQRCGLRAEWRPLRRRDGGPEVGRSLPFAHVPPARVMGSRHDFPSHEATIDQPRRYSSDVRRPALFAGHPCGERDLG